MTSQQYDLWEEPDEEIPWTVYAVLKVVLVVVIAFDFVRAIPRRTKDWYRSTFARY